MKNPFKKLAKAVVVLWASYTYEKVAREADALYAKNHRMYYVASKTFRPDMLTVYDRYRFKAEKQVYGVFARILTLQTLKNGCYYHTPDTAGNQALGKHERERRKRFFINERLAKARLI